MGKLLIFLKYVFFVFSSDVNEKRKHVHVTDKRNDLDRICKFWIEPNIKLEYNIGFTNKEINEIEKLLMSNIKEVQSQLNLFYTHRKVKSITKNE
jgi:hypothetical protein